MPALTLMALLMASWARVAVLPALALMMRLPMAWRHLTGTTCRNAPNLVMT